MEQYLGLVYTVATGPMTAGKVTAAIVKDIERWKAYPSGFSVA
jgi:thymidine kinase